MNIQTLLANILTFLNSTIVPFLLALAGFIFLWNIVRFFIIGGSNEESQEKAKSLALWGISAFVLIISLWGIVNLLVKGFGFDRDGAITPDYMCDKTSGNCTQRLPGITLPTGETNTPTSPAPVYQERDAGDRDTAPAIVDEKWTPVTTTDLDRSALQEELSIKDSNIQITNLEESESGKSRVTLINVVTGELITMTRDSVSDREIAFSVVAGGREARYSAQVDDSGNVLIFTNGANTTTQLSPEIRAFVQNTVAEYSRVPSLKDLIPIDQAFGSSTVGN